MVMRVGGIASGMDIDAMVKKLMEAERMPLTRLQQQQTTLEWKRDAFRDINSHLLELDNMMLDMKYSTTYKPKAATSSNSDAITATATSNATNGSYEIKVDQLATNAINVGEKKAREEIQVQSGTHVFYTFNEDGTSSEHNFEITDEDSLDNVLKKITDASDGRVRAFYEETSQQVVLEATRSGQYRPGTEGAESDENKLPEIEFATDSVGFFKDTLGLVQDNEKGGVNAKFTYNNGLKIESQSNEYTINGLQLTFHQVTDTNARISVTTDVDQSFDKIMAFVEKYNETIDVMNQSQNEERHRDFPPLTEDQKAEMTEEQITRWEEKAQSGILRGESTISNGMYSLRQSLQQSVDTGGAYTLLSQIGIKTTANYMDGGKLEVNEEQLRTALRDNPDDVYKLFSHSEEGSSRGLINRFDDVLDRTRGSIEEKAGKSTHTLDNYQLGKNMKELNERISDFERRMVQVEQRYWNQFTAMEKAISRLNQQSSHLFSQFGGQ